MSFIYAIVLYASAVFIFGCLVYNILKPTDNPIEKPVRNVLGLSMLSLSSYATAIIAHSETMAYIAYSIYNIFIDLMLIAVLLFARRFTGLTRGIKIENRIFLIGAAADSVIMIANPLLKWAFSCNTYWDKFEKFFYQITDFKFLYIVHIVFVYAIIFAIFLVLGIKIYNSPKIYKMKYISIFLVIFAVILIHSFYIKFSWIFDYSLTLYALTAFMFFYFSVFYVPRGLMERLLFFTVANMKDGIICIDVDGKCVHANKPARIYADAEVEIKNLETQIEKWFEEKINGNNKDMEWDSEIRIDGKTRYYTIEYKQIFDNSMKYLGCFFLLNDKTDEYNTIFAEKYRANHDTLTGIYNKEYFYENSKKTILANPSVLYYIICTDVKNFKIINDMFGVDEGDRLLKQIAKITEEFKEEGCVYGRISGDRFGICMPKSRFSKEEMLEKYSKVSTIVKRGSYKVHIHIGVYEVEDPSLRISVMCDRANLAIKTIKESYENVVAFYDEKLRENFIIEQKVIGEFEEAIASGQFVPFIQPQISTEGYVKGGEALVRWIHPKDGMIPPYKFIPIFEKTGLISRLDSYMWEQACIKLKEWHDSGLDNSYISVNISQKDFYLLDVYETFTSLVKKYSLNPKFLHLEITETAIMNSPETQLPLLDKLKKFGFIIEIDDFGSGYSSLNTLKDIQADVLKIDMRFLEKTEHQHRSKVILQMIIALAKSLTMEVITEGVETKEQVEFLARFGCDIYQGYYFAKPMPINEFEEKFLDTYVEM